MARSVSLPSSPKKNTLSTLTRSSSTIQSIPNELLELVFYHATRPPSNRSFFHTPSMNHNPFAPLFPRSTGRIPESCSNRISRPFIYDIASVSRSWREIAMQNSSLWSNIHLTRPLSVHRSHKTTLDPHFLSWLTTHLSRCQSSANLHVVLDCTRLPPLGILLPYLLPTTPRWASLVLLVSHVGVLPQTLAYLEDIPVPMLKELEIAADVYREGIVCTDIIPGFFKSGAPKLEKVRLNRVYVSWLEHPLVRAPSSGSLRDSSPIQLSPAGGMTSKIRPLKQTGIKITTLELRFTSWWPDFEDLVKLFAGMPKLRVLIVHDDLSAIIRNVAQPPAPPPHPDPPRRSSSPSGHMHGGHGGSPTSSGSSHSSSSPRSKTPVTRDSTRRRPPPEAPKIELPSLAVLELHSFKPPSRPSQLSSNLNPEVSPLPQLFLQLFDLPVLEELRIRGITPAQWNDCLVPYFIEQVQERGRFGMLQRLVLGEFVDDEFDSSIQRLFKSTLLSQGLGYGYDGLPTPSPSALHRRCPSIISTSPLCTPWSTTPFVLNPQDMQAAFPCLTSLRLDHVDPNPFIDLFLGEAYDLESLDEDGWDTPTGALWPPLSNGIRKGLGKDTHVQAIRTVQPIWPFLRDLAINLAFPAPDSTYPVPHEHRTTNGRLLDSDIPTTTNKSRDSLRRLSDLQMGDQTSSTLSEFITKMENIETDGHGGAIASGLNQNTISVVRETKKKTSFSHHCELIVLATALMSRTILSRPLRKVWLDKEFMLEGMVDVLKQHRVEVRDVRFHGHGGLDCDTRLWWPE